MTAHRPETPRRPPNTAAEAAVDGAADLPAGLPLDDASPSDTPRRVGSAASQGGERELPEDGHLRVVIEGVEPQIDGGRYAVKRVVDEPLPVEADAFLAGHDEVACALLWRGEEDRSAWQRVAMTSLGNDRWAGRFTPREIGRYRYTIEAWVDRFGTWRHDLEKRIAAGQDLDVPLQVGAQLLERAAVDAAEAGSLSDAARLRAAADAVRGADVAAAQATALDAALMLTVQKHPDLRHATRLETELPLVVDPPIARFSAWYEAFPRSAAPEPGRHGTFRDLEARLPLIVEMGFDVLYLPPIHPIGRTFRKGRNNATAAGPMEPGSPWAIGAPDGGHRSIHSELGTDHDFRRLVRTARAAGVEIALDIAFQASPDHPHVQEHPEWFRIRPDGSIQYAENPPKRYQDIYPYDFEGSGWSTLWPELRDTVLHWVERGVRIFRVDNPHTKPFAFWEWLISDVKRQHPEVLFLAEAFTRPKVMARLAKLGFSQSYTYFAWRNTKWELTDYFTELAHGPSRWYLRPNVWPNTPDILTEYLQLGGPPAFVMRLILAATLSANYGIYGPAFETFRNIAREPGSEEYLDSEKYQIEPWDPDAPNMRSVISRINAIRRRSPALQTNEGLRFHATDNDQLLCYSKSGPRAGDVPAILCIVNLDPHNVQGGWVTLALRELGLDDRTRFQVEDLLDGETYTWQGPRNYVELRPFSQAAHVFSVRAAAGDGQRDPVR